MKINSSLLLPAFIKNRINTVCSDNMKYQKTFVEFLNKYKSPKKESLLDKPRRFSLFAIIVEGEIVSFVSVHNEIFIHDLFTIKEHRMKGFARTLILFILNKYKHDIYLMVDIDNKIALNLYNSIGFEKVLEWKVEEVANKSSYNHADFPVLSSTSRGVIFDKIRVLYDSKEYIIKYSISNCKCAIENKLLQLDFTNMKGVIKRILKTNIESDFEVTLIDIVTQNGKTYFKISDGKGEDKENQNFNVIEDSI